MSALRPMPKQIQRNNKGKKNENDKPLDFIVATRWDVWLRLQLLWIPCLIGEEDSASSFSVGEIILAGHSA